MEAKEKGCKFIVVPEKGKVIALMKYHGKDVRGTAVCSVNDKFDIETGKKLAYLRMKQKIAEKSCKFHFAQLKIVDDIMEELKKYQEKEAEHIANAEWDRDEATRNLEEFEATL